MEIKKWYKLNYAQKDKYTGFLICGAQIFTPINTDYRKQTHNCLGSEGDQWEGGEAEEDEVVHREHGSKHSASCYGDVPVEASTVYHEHTLELLHSAYTAPLSSASDWTSLRLPSLPHRLSRHSAGGSVSPNAQGFPATTGTLSPGF